MGARALLKYTRERYDRVMDWFKRPGTVGAGPRRALHGAVVLVTLWLLGALDWSANLVGIEWPWLKSPIGIGVA